MEIETDFDLQDSNNPLFRQPMQVFLHPEQKNYYII